ncbi:uncharacterized protein B0H18DRAFT_937053 [Fomitopsis serialis]|uniref:uncharacterized protein n=1 Tax=Fomitopsis serialis TaxID=139415 RepID=UPI0020086471|nr:uncharacterized protein B0H18DRAFT_937053 [Neoantrodia serialis]KAH9919714.1 hypothetical protein B0H18DRAFT_937053 [Neoantrodia serialis]
MGVENDSESTDESVPQLFSMLDLAQLNSPEDIETRFSTIASALLNDYRLSVATEHGKTEYDFMEIEFYLYRPGCHADPFTHRSHEQQYAGQWYFHRAPRRSGNEQPSQAQGSGYRGGTRKGLDLTIGVAERDATRTESTQTRGGILLRTLRRVSDQKVFSGPSLLVDEILRASRAKSVAELVTARLRGDISAFSISVGGAVGSAPPVTVPAATNAHLRLMRIQPNRGRFKPRIFQSPRIGLDLSNPDIPKENPHYHSRVQFVAKHYRYFVHPHLLTANGRGQTFLGVYLQCTAQPQFDDDDEIIEEVARLTGLKVQTARNYLAEYRWGLEQGQLKAFLGTAGKGASAAPATFLRMMGTLAKLDSQQQA